MTTERTAMLRRLAEDGTVKMDWPAAIVEGPAPFPANAVTSGRVRGMLLGLAIGDALGATSESMRPAERRERYGEIRDYLPHPYADQRRIGLPTDDTQLAFLMLAHLLEHGRIEPNALAQTYCSGRIFGIGRSTRQFVAAWKRTRDWCRAGQESAGNGGLMRIAPVVLPHLATASAELWVDAVLATAISHNDRAAIASSVAFTGMLGELLVTPGPPPAEWWVQTFVERARAIEGDATRYRSRSPQLAGAPPGPLWRLVAERVPPALGQTVTDAGEIWCSGAYLLETVPTVLHLLARHARDPEEAIVRAVNDTRDNDTVAAIVGAAVGALHGDAALPVRWKDALAGRVIADRDEPNVFGLIDSAIERFVGGSVR